MFPMVKIFLRKKKFMEKLRIKDISKKYIGFNNTIYESINDIDNIKGK